MFKREITKNINVTMIDGTKQARSLTTTLNAPENFEEMLEVWFQGDTSRIYNGIMMKADIDFRQMEMSPVLSEVDENGFVNDDDQCQELINHDWCPNYTNKRAKSNVEKATKAFETLDMSAEEKAALIKQLEESMNK